MQIHITKIYNIGGTAAQSQHMVAEIAKSVLNCTELGIHHYPVESDSSEMLRARQDGILAAVKWYDVVIFQSPSWNGVHFDRALMERVNVNRGVKKVFFIHDVVPLMFENNRYLLGKYIELYNQADLLILPSQNMADFLYKEGLNVHQYVVQRMWDCPLSVNTSVIPRFNKLIQFAGQTDGFKFSFVQRWKYESVRLAVTASEGDWEHGENIEFLGWFQDQNLLANTMRRNGGFGLLWTEDEYCKEYMTLNACSKLSLYLASGIPVIVHNSIPEADTIFQKNLGLVVDSLDEAVEKIEKMTKDQYDQMVQNVASFGRLLRGGFFTRKVLTDALFQLLYN